jgi:hypothetical protein
MEIVKYDGWDCIRLTNGKVELLVTRDIGPRIIRYGFIGGPNVLGEIPEHIGGRGEAEWMNRGGHRLWIAPEADPWSYEPDNEPYASAIAISGGVRTVQAAGPITGLEKRMDIVLDPDSGFVKIEHRLTNRSDRPVRCAVWTISVAGLNGRAILPLPEKKLPPNQILTAIQRWATWSYTDLADPRWTFGSRFVMLRQDPSATVPQKIGMGSDAGWMAYERENMLFVKKYCHFAGAEYPDFGTNVQIYTNKDILELEQLGPLVTLQPGEESLLPEEWRLYGDFAPCKDEADVFARVVPLV